MKNPFDSPPPEGNDHVGSLVRFAGARVTPSGERLNRARRSVHAEWRAANARRRRAMWMRVAAVLACAAIGLWVVQSRVDGGAVRVATVSRITGDVHVRSAREPEARLLVPERGLLSGDVLDSSSGGRVLLRWLQNADVRMDSGSTVLLKSPGELELLRGAVYVETLGRPGQPAEISVATAEGRVRHIGTQFEVRIDRGNLLVRVRDGSAVFVRSWTNRATIRAGQQLLVSGRKMTLAPGPSATDPSWSWTRDVAPGAGIGSRSLFEVLQTLSREAGIRVVYETAETRDKAREIRLHGRLDGLPVSDALRAALDGSGLEYTVYPDRVEIRIPRPP
jgi:ferric-dicitrate binding protein FerR (iron transport regulator)